MKFLASLICALLVLCAAVPVEAGGHCNVQALQAFAGGHAVQAQAVVAAPVVQQVVAQPVFAAPVYAQSFAVAQPVFASSGHCAVQAAVFAQPVVQVQRAARVQNQRVKSKAKSRIR